jgi:hypothetical protein
MLLTFIKPPVQRPSHLPPSNQLIPPELFASHRLRIRLILSGKSFVLGSVK